MTIKLYHHPFSRAATVVWMLEEVAAPYELSYVDLRAGAHKAQEILALNPMGKLPILVDGEATITETAAIGLYLADRYAPGRLAPALDDPRRATYLRWSLFSPSVVEPCVAAKASKWEYSPSQTGWGTHDAVMTTMQFALGSGPYLLGETFSMADVIFGATVRFLLTFQMLEPLPAFRQYVDRLEQRPALQRATARNEAIMAEHGLARG